jgi:nucleoside-diphosphate-sugar epimerase
MIDGTILVATKVRKGFDVFNLATGKITTVVSIAESVMSYSGKHIQPIFKEMLSYESFINYADRTKIKKHRFELKYFVEDGIRHYVEWDLK